MKIYIYGLLLIFSFACTTTKVVHNPSKNNIMGSWKLTSINNPENEASESPLFDVAMMTCLEGSVWNFNDDKTSGTITMNETSCVDKLRKIRWLIYEPGDGTVNFQFKYVSTDEEAPKINAKGFQTKIDKMDGSVMVMHTKSSKDNSSPTTLTFNKIIP